jgi:C4-dicarboxylate-specific signal transduction histidine kinase
MAAGGRLAILTQAVYNVYGTGCVPVQIAHTDVGIPSEDLQRTFALSFTKKGLRQGTGLGLAIC